MRSLGFLLLLVLSAFVTSPSVFAANTIECPAFVTNVSMGAVSNFNAPDGWRKKPSAVRGRIALPRNDHYVDLQGKHIVCSYGVVGTPGGNYPVAIISKPFPGKATCAAIKDYRFECGAGAMTMAPARAPAEMLSRTPQLAAPVQLSPADGSRFSHYPRRTKLRWRTVAGAVSYAAEVQFCPGQRCTNANAKSFKRQERLSNNEYTFSFLGAQGGRWRVWANDSDGKPGTKSSWRAFSYSK